MLQELLNKISIFSPKITGSLFIFIAFWVGGITLQKLVLRLGKKTEIDKNVLNLMGRTIKMILLILGFITMLSTLGINVSALVAGLGLTGFALGFALKDVLSNLLAGILILIYRPFQCRDHISVVGFEGTITEINLRYTSLQGKDKRFLIPNSTIFTNPMVLHYKEKM